MEISDNDAKSAQLKRKRSIYTFLQNEEISESDSEEQLLRKKTTSTQPFKVTENSEESSYESSSETAIPNAQKCKFDTIPESHIEGNTGNETTTTTGPAATSTPVQPPITSHFENQDKGEFNPPENDEPLCGNSGGAYSLVRSSMALSNL